ncbi:hypothetical protein QC763_602330 [Podospora pseudopauciseta]|uniref:DUF7587 domain-containing protein n=1 Tax=Podospora pseudopauciseta TaxID=2093780 RepID=A0ABR0H4R6_9PEZI|nr:hypothetical protein QC763_602330 [Podospora pseudopauciseta]
MVNSWLSAVYPAWALDDKDFKQAVYNQFDWDYKGRTPFISCFSDKDFAIKWACKIMRSSRRCSQKQEFIDCMDIRTPDRAEEVCKPGAYICLHSIPSGAIVEAEKWNESSRSIKIPSIAPSCRPSNTNMVEYRDDQIAKDSE